MNPRDEQITTLFYSGLSQRAIAKAVGVSQPAIHKRLHRLGLLSSPSDNLAVTSHKGESDNQMQGRTFPDNPPAQCESPETHFPLSAQAHVPVRQHQEVGDNQPPTALPPGTVACGICDGAFKPQSPGQKYCCNACGALAAGYKPVVEHAENCLLLELKEAKYQQHTSTEAHGEE